MQAIPGELRDLPQWVLWRVETRRNGKGELVRTKVPYQPSRPQAKAQSTNPDTWGTFREALGVLDADGIGFVFSPDDPYCGVDMDRCVSERGAVHPGAYRVVKRLGGYVEFSPSGTGLHVIVRASLERGRHTLKTEWGEEFAIYDRGRFFTMRGDGRGEPREAQAEVDALIAYYFPEEERQEPLRGPSKPFSGHDSDVLDRILKDPRTAALWAGDASDYGGDHSAADLALCAHLSYWTGGDPARIDSLFRASGLYREKWERADYREATIQRAIRGGRA